jgi:hypothetical protein
MSDLYQIVRYQCGSEGVTLYKHVLTNVLYNDKGEVAEEPQCSITSIPYETTENLGPEILYPSSTERGFGVSNHFTAPTGEVQPESQSPDNQSLSDTVGQSSKSTDSPVNSERVSTVESPRPTRSTRKAT